MPTSLFAHDIIIRSRLASLGFLRFAVEQSIDSRGERLKEYVLALQVFDRGESFDPRIDPNVRGQAGNLRGKLRDYYAGEGRQGRARREWVSTAPI